MDNNTPVRLRVIAAGDPASSKLIASLRQDGLAVTAAGLPDADTLDREIRESAWDLLLVVAHPAVPVDAIVARVGKGPDRFPLLLTVPPTHRRGASSAYGAVVSEVIPQQDIMRVRQAVRQHAAHQRAIRLNHHLKRQLHELVRRQQHLLDLSDQAIALVKDGNHLYANPAYSALFAAQSGTTLVGTAITGLVQEQDRPALQRLLAQQAPDHDYADLDGPDGKLRFTCQPTVFGEDDCLQVSVSPAPGNAEYARRKQQMSRQDLITRLDNLASFHARLESAIAAAISRQVHSVLLVVQIERFTDVRAGLGRSATNAVLAEIAEFLYRTINKPFTASRLADDEFGLLLYNSSPDEGVALADHIREKVGSAVADSGDNLARISVVAGIAVLNAHALDAEAMLCRARMNRDRARDGADTAADMAALVTDALNAKRLGLVYQPVLAFRDDGRERYEVLVRLFDDTGKCWLPDSFLPHANINNLGEAIDRQVLTMLLARPALVGHSQRTLMIHLTSNTLANLTLLPWLNKRLGRCPHLADRLIIQINEIDLLNDSGQVRDFAACLDKLGIGICLNRFGVAIDPLAAIRTLKPVMVRLDDTLVRDLFYSREQQDSVRKLIRAVRHQHVKVAVTRIEDMERLPLLWELGVDFVQGCCIQAPAVGLDFPFPQEEEILLTF